MGTNVEFQNILGNIIQPIILGLRIPPKKKKIALKQEEPPKKWEELSSSSQYFTLFVPMNEQD